GVTSWNFGNVIGVPNFGVLSLNANGAADATYDLRANTLNYVPHLVGYGQDLSLLINSAVVAGVRNFSAQGTNDRLVTSDGALDLSHTTVSGFAVSSTNATGTTFTVSDIGTALQIVGGPGQDVIAAHGFTFTADQLNDIFATTSVETI